MKLTLDLHQNHLQISLKKGLTLVKLWFPRKATAIEKEGWFCPSLPGPTLNSSALIWLVLITLRVVSLLLALAPKRARHFPSIHCFLAKAHTNTNKKSYQSLTAKKTNVPSFIVASYSSESVSFKWELPTCSHPPSNTPLFVK